MVQEEEETKGSPRVFLAGLLNETTKATLKTFFADHGTVLDVIFKYGPDGKRKRGVAYVLFESQDSVAKLLEKKSVTIDEKKVDVKKARDEEEGQKDEEPLLAIPKEALKCHVCKKDKFSSVEAFLQHRKGKQHQAVLKLFKSKSASVLQLLKAESKLASDRTFDKGWMKRHKVGPQHCNICQCQVNGNPEKHNKSMEHKMVVSYNNQKCCNTQFTDRTKYESHLLSLRHLKNTYEKDQKREFDKDEAKLTMKKAIDIYKQCDADLKELKQTYPELDLNAELPEYEENKPIGLNFIVKKINYHCICCDQRFFAHVNLVEPHCRSYDHFANMTDYINKIEIEKKKAQKKAIDGAEVKAPVDKKRTLSTSNDTTVKKKGKIEINKKGATLEKSSNDEVSAADQKKVKAENDEEMTNVEKPDEEENVDEQEHKDVDENQDAEADEENQGNEEDEEAPMEEEEQEEGEEEEEEEVQGEEQEEVQAEEVEEVQAEEDEEVQAEDDDEIQILDDKVEDTEENNSEEPVEEATKDVAEEEEEVTEIEEVKPARATPRGRRGRGRGRGLKR